MGAEVTLVGNEGFRITTPEAVVYVDAFYGAIPGVAAAAALRANAVEQADLILVTHAHWDHFNADEVADVARRTGAVVVGPRQAIKRLGGAVPAPSLVEIEPRPVRGTKMASMATAQVRGASITAFRTFHGANHNSYLVATPSFRFFHDGDNENTRRIDLAALGRIDALLIGPWQGSGWVEFIEAIAPTRYFLMHMTDQELDEIDAGTYLPEICDHVPEGLVVLRPGESFTFGSSGD